MSTLTITSEQLQVALLRWEQDAREGRTLSHAEAGAMWAEEVAAEGAKRLWFDLQKSAGKQLTFNEFRAANVTRCEKWHHGDIHSWSPSDWMTALVGEVGELASLLKMRNRERDGLPGNKFSPTDEQIANEAADVVTYLDLLCAYYGIDLGLAAAKKFNEISERVGFPDRIEI